MQKIMVCFKGSLLPTPIIKSWRKVYINMKKKKLVLNKEVISSLDQSQMTMINGGNQMTLEECNNPISEECIPEPIDPIDPPNTGANTCWGCPSQMASVCYNHC